MLICRINKENFTCNKNKVMTKYKKRIAFECNPNYAEEPT